MMGKPSGSVKRRTSNTLSEYIKENRNKLIVSVASLILGVAILGTLSDVAKEWLIQHWFSRKAKVNIQLISSSLGIFGDVHSERIIQIMAYRVSVSDLTKDIIITATFPQFTEIINCHVTYTVDLTGFRWAKPQKNHVEIKLDHPLDVSKEACIYLWTESDFVSGQAAKLEVPDIHIEGKVRNGKTIYR